MVGETIARYKVTEKIGQGGMGEVYRATDRAENACQWRQEWEATDPKYNSLEQCVWVSTRFEMLCRRNNLSWSHHPEVASYSNSNQIGFATAK